MTGAELALLTLLVFQEARGEPFLGQVAVAEVAINRSKLPHYPKKIKKVIKQPYQFSGMGASGVAQTPAEAKRRNPEAWAKAKAAVSFALTAETKFSTATHFHATYVRPKWAKPSKKLGRIGQHVFYNLH